MKHDEAMGDLDRGFLRQKMTRENLTPGCWAIKKLVPTRALVQTQMGLSENVGLIFPMK